MMTGYTATVLRYASASEHVGMLDSPDGTGEAGLSGPGVGSRLAVRFTLRVHGELLAEIRFQVFGCGFTIAACAAAAKLVTGWTLERAEKIQAEDINRVLENGLPPERDYCAELACAALRAAVESVHRGGEGIRIERDSETEVAADHGPRIAPDDPLLKALLEAAATSGQPAADGRMFAGLLTLASREPPGLPQTLGIEACELEMLLNSYFPGFDASRLMGEVRRGGQTVACQPSPELVSLLRSHVPQDGTATAEGRAARWLADMIALRAGHPGHLWVSMGLARRADLSEAIRRHLPSLAEGNQHGMRWKRYLFKQLCDLNGGVMCKSPNCGECSDYALCFADD